MANRRRGNGEGAIYKHATRDVWVGKIDLGEVDGKRTRRVVHGRTRTEVAERLRAIRAESVQVRASSVRTVADLLERWLDTAALAKFGEDSTTYLGYRHQAEQHIVPVLGAVRLDRLHPEQIDDYLAAKAREGYSRGTLVKHRSVLGQALRWGVKRRHLTWDPASLAEMPAADVFARATPKQTRAPRALTTAEARVFIDATADRRNGCALVLALTTGLRPGELTALTWADVDLDDAVVHVRRAWKGRDEHRHLGEPKTKGSVRSIGLAAPMVERLRAHRLGQLEDRMKSRAWADPDLELVFATPDGGPLDPSNLRRLTSDIADGAKLGHLSPYDLRHSATSLLSEAGVRNEELADLLGHVDTRMVERHYRHRLTTSVEVAAAPMAALLDNVG